MTNRILKLSIFVIAITSLTSSSLADCGCTADVNGDATVSGTDLAIVIGSWGPASSGMPGADINADGTVDAQDLGLLLAAWGNCPGPESILTNPDAIRVLAKSAYVWGLPLEFSYRFGNYNALMTAEVNSLAYPPAPAAWNNASTNAGNASVLSISLATRHWCTRCRIRARLTTSRSSWMRSSIPSQTQVRALRRMRLTRLRTCSSALIRRMRTAGPLRSMVTHSL